METKPTTHNLLLRSDFVIDGEILTKARPRAAVINGFARIYTPKTTLTYENYIKSCYENQCIDKITNELIYFKDYPLYVEIIAHFKAPDKFKNLTKEELYDLPCTKNKDLDNIAKTILDALNGIAYEDDKQVRTLLVQKYWDKEREYVEVVIQCDGLTTEEWKNDYKAKEILAKYIEERNKPKPKVKRLETLWNSLQPYLPESKRTPFVFNNNKVEAKIDNSINLDKQDKQEESN